MLVSRRDSVLVVGDCKIDWIRTESWKDEREGRRFLQEGVREVSGKGHGAGGGAGRGVN